MSRPTYIARLTLSLLLFAGAGSVSAASNTNALLGASEPLVLELNDSSPSSQSRSVMLAGSPLVSSSATSSATNASAQRLPQDKDRGFDWSTLISLGFGVVGLLWVRRRTADL